MQEEIYRLAKENNHMLHSMRRNAFFAGIFKFVFYILILVVAPLWIYTSYLSPILQEATQTLVQVQGVNGKTQSQFSGLLNEWKQIQSKLPSSLQTK